MNKNTILAFDRSERKAVQNVCVESQKGIIFGDMR